jgi:hypothetical protein
VRVDEDQEAVQEAVQEGGGARGFGRRSASPATGVERGEVGEACGQGGGGAAGVGGGPGADCAGGGLEVHEQWVGTTGREAVGAHVVELFIRGGGARLAEWEGDGAPEGGRHCSLNSLWRERPAGRKRGDIYRGKAPISTCFFLHHT